MIAVVTGAGSGIGRAVSRALLRAGYQVALAGRRSDALDETGADFAAEQWLAIPTDVTDDVAVAELFATVEKHWGRLDLLFNNAGMFGPAGSVVDLDTADFARGVAVNLIGAYSCAHHAAALMARQRPSGGRIINNGSISATTPRPNSAAYSTAKHAITGLTKSISLDGRAFQIACGQIDIGNAGTDMMAATSTGMLQADGRMAVEPTFDVAHVADAVLYMAGLPLEANVQFLTLMATAMPFIGRG